MLLSEVLLERDQQVEYKQRKIEAIKRQDTKYLESQAVQREAAIHSDMQAAERRARKKNATANFQIAQYVIHWWNVSTRILLACVLLVTVVHYMFLLARILSTISLIHNNILILLIWYPCLISTHTRAAVKSQTKAKVRQVALKEQKQLDEEVKEFHQQQREIESKLYDDKLAHRKALDVVLKQKREREKAEIEKKMAEDEEIKIFVKAKKVRCLFANVTVTMIHCTCVYC